MDEQKRSYTNKQVVFFVIIIFFLCALVLYFLSTAHTKPQGRARALYKSKQLLLSSKILGYEGFFLIESTPQEFVPAVYDSEKKLLKPAPKLPPPKAKDAEILEIYQARIYPRLVDEEGNMYTFEQLKIDEESYIREHEKRGFAHLKYKLIYLIISNLPSVEQINDDLLPYGYVIPINGHGLWGPIYGYLTLAADANRILGTTWYDQEETPGLGGNIALPNWQRQFFNKQVFQQTHDKANLERTPLGVIIVKTAVSDELKDSPKAKSAVDGIPGATITVKGVTEAYRSSLAPYRSFLIKAKNHHNKVNLKLGNIVQVEGEQK